MSDAFLAIGFCCVAGVAILGEHVIFRTEGIVDIEFAANWLSRFYPVILFFLYIIMRPLGCCHLHPKDGVFPNTHEQPLALLAEIPSKARRYVRPAVRVFACFR